MCKSSAEIIYTDPTETLGIRVQYDDDCSNPWTDSDLGFEFRLGTRRGDYAIESDDCPSLEDACKSKSDYWVFPVHAYIHSGIALSLTGKGYPFNDRWDSGVLGYLAVRRPSRGGEWRTRKAFLTYASVAVETLADYWNGQCFGYEIYDLSADEVLDSCWGFIGFDHSQSGLLDQAMDSLNYALSKE